MSPSEKKQCKATTRKELQCKQLAMKGGDYCYIHSFRFKRVPWWKSSATHILAIIGITATLLAWHFGASKKGQTQTNQKLDTIVVNTKELKAAAVLLLNIAKDLDIDQKSKDEINRLINTMANQESDRMSELNKEYPLGYVTFAIHTGTKTIWPMEHTSDNKFRIDWSKAKVVAVTKDFVDLQTPDVYVAFHDAKSSRVSGNKISGNIIGIPREVGRRWTAFITTYPDRSYTIEGRVLFDNESGFVCVIGAYSFLTETSNLSFEEEAELFRKEYRTAKNNNDTGAIIKAANALAGINIMSNRLTVAENFLEEAIELAEEKHMENLLPACYTNKGIILLRKERFDEAEEFACKCIKLAQNYNNRIFEATGNHNLGMIKQTRGDIKSAIFYWKEAQKIFNELRMEKAVRYIQELIDEAERPR